MVRPTLGAKERFVNFLAPNLLAGTLPFLILPLTTTILGPEDYGQFALVTGVTSMAGAFAGLGAGFFLAHRFRPELTDQMRTLVTTVAMTLMASSLVLAFFASFGYYVAARFSEQVAAVPPIALVFASIDIVATNMWSIAAGISTLSRRNRQLAIFLSLRVLANATVVLLALFPFHIHGPMALFFGLAASGGVLLVGAVVILYPYLSWAFDRRVFREVSNFGGWMAGARLVDVGRQLVERWTLGLWGSVAATGIFVHAQAYMNMVSGVISPILQTVQPRLLDEARAEKPCFAVGRIAVYLILVVSVTAACGVAFIGPELISILTHGKFTAAAPYAAVLLATLPLRFGARPQQAVLAVEGRAARAALISALSALVSIGSMVVLIPLWGLDGAVGATIIYSLAVLAMRHLGMRRIKRTPNLDGGALLGLVAVTVLVVVVDVLEPAFWFRAVLFGLTAAAGSLATYRLWRRVAAV